VEQLREVRFFLDWGHWWPLWESGTEKYAMEPSDYGFSEDLTSRLRLFYDHWYEHVDPVLGWDSKENERVFLRAKAELIHLIREELPTGVTLHVG
jgi:hypothetical protein